MWSNFPLVFTGCYDGRVHKPLAMGCGGSSERLTASEALPAPMAPAAALLTVTAPEFAASTNAATTETAAEELLAH